MAGTKANTKLLQMPAQIFLLLCNFKHLLSLCIFFYLSNFRISKLEKFEVPGAISLTAIEWGPESGLVTAAMKLKRKPLQVGS